MVLHSEAPVHFASVATALATAWAHVPRCARLAISVWAQLAAARAMDHGMQTLSEYESRISLAIQWKGATETTGERVLASNASTDEELTRLLDGRVKEGSALITKLQAEIVKGAS